MADWNESPSPEASPSSPFLFRRIVDAKLVASVDCTKGHDEIWWYIDVGPGLNTKSRVGGPVSFTVSPDGRHVLTAGDDGQAVLWSTRGGEKVGWLYHRHLERPNWATMEFGKADTCRVVGTFSRDSHRVLTLSSDGDAIVWDILPQKNGSRFKVGSTSVEVGWFDPTGTYVVTGHTDGSWSIWDADTGGSVARSSQDVAPPQVGLAWHITLPSGRQFLLADEQTWSLDVQSLRGLGSVLRLLSALPSSSAAPSAYGLLSPNGAHRLYGDAIVYVPMNKAFALLHGHESRVVCASFLDGEKRVLTATEDGVLRFWETIYESERAFRKRSEAHGLGAGKA